MTIQIRALGTSAAEHASRKSAVDRATPMRDLGRALESGDLVAASAAYATLATRAPERVVQNPDAPFARLGAALAAGDLTAARSAYASIFASHVPSRNDGPSPVVASSGANANQTTVGTPGALLDVSA